MPNLLAQISMWIALHWRTCTLIACVVAIAATYKSCLETTQASDNRAELNRKKEIRRLADKISTYGRKVHARYPSGDVVVSVHDLAEQLRKRPEIIAAALNLLLGKQKVQRVSLKGYWKLNV
jgi:hypothetical protein